MFKLVEVVENLEPGEPDGKIVLKCFLFSFYNGKCSIFTFTVFLGELIYFVVASDSDA